MTDPISYVYILAKDLEPGFAPPIKVGVSRNPSARALDIRTATPFEVAVYASFKAPNFVAALEWERGFHEALEEWHLQGEWFSLPPFSALEKILWSLFSRLTISGGISKDDAISYMRTIAK